VIEPIANEPTRQPQPWQDTTSGARSSTARPSSTSDAARRGPRSARRSSSPLVTADPTLTPTSTVERAIRKGAGGEDTSNYENIRYEGYGPGGVAVIIETLTDNRARTVGDIRLAFSDHGGNIGGSGCVAYMFASKGRIVVAAEGLVEDAVMEKAIEAGATDVEPLDEGDDEHPPSWIIWTEVAAFASVKTNVEKARLPVIDAGLVMVPDNHVAVTGEQADTIAALIEALEDLDDVQKVYSNASFE
jgi:YebC/PmpR family DNA-binding regulatory protein